MKKLLPALLLISFLFGQDRIEIAKQIVKTKSNYSKTVHDLNDSYYFYAKKGIENDMLNGLLDTAMDHQDYLNDLTEYLLFRKLLSACGGDLNYVETRIFSQINETQIGFLKTAIMGTKFHLVHLTKEGKGGEVMQGEGVLRQLMTVLNIIEEQDDPYFKF